MTVFVGIDTGLTGAVAFRNDSSMKVFDTPTIKEEKRGKSRRIYDVKAMDRLFLPYTKIDVVVALELAHAFPGEGSVSSFRFGFGFGLYQGIIIAHGFELVVVSPRTWKSAVFGEMKADKNESIVRAIQMFPYLESSLSRKMDHNRAEAILIAEWLKNTRTKENQQSALGL